MCNDTAPGAEHQLEKVSWKTAAVVVVRHTLRKRLNFLIRVYVDCLRARGAAELLKLGFAERCSVVYTRFSRRCRAMGLQLSEGNVLQIVVHCVSCEPLHRYFIHCPVFDMRRTDLFELVALQATAFLLYFADEFDRLEFLRRYLL